MTFAEYNTDENFNGNSNAMDLVKLGKDEGMTEDQILTSLSPLWKEDKKGNVRKALDYHFPKTEEKEEEKTELPESNIEKKDKKFLNETNAISNEAEIEEMKRQRELQKERYNNTRKRIEESSETFGKIDDHYLDNIPTFMTHAYARGEFGKPGSAAANLRFGHLLADSLGTTLSNISHVINKDGKVDESEWDKIKNTNMSKGLENRWNKYREETNSAIELAKSRNMTEEEIDNSIATISSNNRLNTAFRMMDENQKVYLMEVANKVGELVGNKDMKDVSNILVGGAITGDVSKDEVSAIAIAQLVNKSPKMLDTLKEKYPNNPIVEMVTAIVDGDDGGIMQEGLTPENAGVGIVSGNGITKKAKLSDGTEYDPGLVLTPKDVREAITKAEDVMQKYFDGKIDKETFLQDYGAIYDRINMHGVGKHVFGSIKSPKDALATMEENYLKYKVGKGKVNDAKKSGNYMRENKALFDYFQSTEEPNFLDAKDLLPGKKKDMSEYQKAKKHYNNLKDKGILEYVTKFVE